MFRVSQKILVSQIRPKQVKNWKIDAGFLQFYGKVGFFIQDYVTQQSI